MSDETFLILWIFSFGIYILAYTYWIPLRTQKKIEQWLRSESSDETLLLSLEVITKEIRERAIVDFEEFMLPRAKEAFQKFWAGAMGNAAQSLGKTEEGSGLALLQSMSKDLQGQPWYVQAAASKLLPVLTEAANKTGEGSVSKAIEHMGLRK